MSESAARPRIAVLLPDLRPGGVERMRITLAQVWLARGCDVDFVVMRDEGALRDALPERARLVVLGAPRIRGVLVPLRHYLRRTRPDALLAAMWPLTVAAVIAARSLLPPCASWSAITRCCRTLTRIAAGCTGSRCA